MKHPFTGKAAKAAAKFAFAGLFAAALMCPSTADAKPAARGIIQMELPDGSTIPVQMYGDEFAHRVFTEDGYLLTADSEGFYYYASLDNNGNIVSSKRRATSMAKRSADDASFLQTLDRASMAQIAETADNARRVAKLNSRANTPAARAQTSSGIDFLFSNYPSQGSPKGLIIIVEYADFGFKMTGDPYDYFNRMVTEEGFSTNGATGSAYDWFKENSKGKFTPDFDVYGPVKLSKNRSYYGGNDMYGNDLRPEEMVIEACKALDATIDFSLYDTDNDGYIDNVYVFYAGGGEADGGGTTTVWPHSWNIEGGAGKSVILDGVKLDRYACSAEWDTSNRRPDGIGTFVHEFSHVMGLPDLYTTVYNNAFTPGEWSVMDYGPYNNAGRTPPNYSIFERYSLGWVEPNRFSGKADNKSYRLADVTCNEGYLVPTYDKNDFYMLEFRKQEGNDKYLPNTGMLAWRIRYNSRAWKGNTVNNDPTLQRVDIIEADNIRTEASMAGDCFPGTKNVTEFTATSVPSFTDAKGESVGVELHNINVSPMGYLTFEASHDVPITAIDEIYGDGNFKVSVDGNLISVEAEGAVRVINLAGVVVANISGNGSIELPSGLYVVTDGRNTSKVVVK